MADEETQHTEHQEACTVLFDVESFCDSISLTLVARAGLKLAHTLVLLALALLTYAGVRFLTAGCSGFSEGIVISNGVAAGCAQGNQAARLALYDIQQNSHELRPSTTTAQWVDDLAQRTQAPPSEVVSKAVVAALQLVQDPQGNKLAVAPKSVVIATTPLIAKQVVSSLARRDIHTSRKPAKRRIWGWCVQRKKANATYHGQETGQGGKTNEKVCEVRKVDFEASHCAALENGGLCAESLWNCGDGCAAIVGQASEDQSGGSRTMRRSRQVFNHDNCTSAPICRSSSSDPVQPHQAVADISGAQSQTQAQD